MILVFLVLALSVVGFVNSSTPCPPACSPGYACNPNDGYPYCQACYWNKYCPDNLGPMQSCSTCTEVLCVTCNNNNCAKGYYWYESKCTIVPANYYNPNDFNGNMYFCPTASTGLVGQVYCRACKQLLLIYPYSFVL